MSEKKDALQVLAAIGALQEAGVKPPYSVKSIKESLEKEYGYSHTKSWVLEGLRRLQSSGLVVLTRRGGGGVGVVPLSDSSAKSVEEVEEGILDRAVRVETITGQHPTELRARNQLLLMARRLKRDTPYSEGGRELGVLIQAIRDKGVIDFEDEDTAQGLDMVMGDLGEQEADWNWLNRPITTSEARHLE